MKIAKNTVVTFDYVLKDCDGKILEKSEEGGSSYLHGYGNLLPALEAELEGKVLGDKVQKKLSAKEGFGERDESLVIKVPRKEFGDDKPEVGQEIVMQSDDGDEDMIFEVIELSDDEITLDGNHPYAGMALDFDISIKDVRQATAEEIERGDIECECDGCCDDHDCDCGCHG